MESWALIEIFFSQNFLVQVSAGITVAIVLGFFGLLLKRKVWDQTKKQEISVTNSSNTNITQVGGNVVQIQKDGILNKLALNKENPVKTLEVAKDIGKILDDDPHYKATLSTDAKESSLSFSPRGKDAPPVTVHSGFEFPRTEEGLKAWGELKNHFETGNLIKIEGKYIKDFQAKLGEKELVPENLRTPDALQKSYLKISTAKDVKPKPATLLIKTERTDEKLEGILFYKEQAGSQQVTISNEKQPYPLKIKLILEKDGQVSTSFSVNVDEFKTASQAYKIIKFLNAFKYAKYFEVNFAEEDRSLRACGPFTNGLEGLEIFGEWLPLLERLNFISNSLRRPLSNPFTKDINKNVIKNTNDAYFILNKGQIPCRLGNLKISIRKENAKELLEKKNVTLRTVKEAFLIDILGTQLDMGSCWAEFKLTAEDLEQMKLDLESQQEDTIETILLKQQEQKTILNFERWETKKALTEGKQ